MLKAKMVSPHCTSPPITTIRMWLCSCWTKGRRPMLLVRATYPQFRNSSNHLQRFTAKNGHTPLHIAARKNQMDIANTLLEYGAQPNAESKAGFTPLHLSAQEGHVDMCSLLLEHKANPNQESKVIIPLNIALKQNYITWF